jgi:dihydroorotate dehydrogenase electron transfer subunit
MSKIKQGVLKILSNKMIDNNHFILSFENEGINPEAGQFLMIDCISKKARNNSYKNGSYLGPLLKRSFSFYLASNDKELSILYKELSILYKVKEWGKGGNCLFHLRSGDEIYYEGPLGKPINIPEVCKKDETAHLIAGGVGIAPITFLAQKLIYKGYKVKIYFGAKKVIGKFLDFCLANLGYIGVDNIMLSTELVSLEKDDMYLNPTIKYKSYKGVPFFVGNMVQALDACWKSIIEEFKGPIFVCGPEIVMKYVHNLCALKMKRGCYVFIERHLGCSKGVCCSCDVNGKLLCVDGPVIRSQDVFGG